MVHETFIGNPGGPTAVRNFPDAALDLKPGSLVPISEERSSECITYIKVADPHSEVWFFDRQPGTDLDRGGPLFERAYGSE